MTILVIVEHNNDQIKSATANALNAAQQIAEKTGSNIKLLVAGQNCVGVADSASAIPGVTQVLLADCAATANQLAENVAPIVVDLVKDDGITHVLAASTTHGKNLLPRVAALLDVAQISDISEVVEDDTFVRPIYAGNALETVKSVDSVKVITIRSSSFDAIESMTGGSASIEVLPEVSDEGISRFISEEIVKSDRPELSSARVVVSGGRALKSGENFSILESLADKVGGAVGASRAAVDAGFVSNDLQVGQTGKIVSPDLYIAAGISGAIQHLAGMKDSRVIVAINSDPEAPIFNVADYGLVADLFEAIPEIESQL